MKGGLLCWAHPICQMSKSVCVPGVQGMAASLIGVLPYAALRLGLYDGELMKLL